MKKGKILKIRPFNMANFSGGSGYLPFFYVYELIALIPYYWLVTSLIFYKNRDDKDNYDRAKVLKVLNRRALPVMLILAVVWTAVLVFWNSNYISVTAIPLCLLCGFMPMGVVYGSLRLIVAVKKVITKKTLYLTGLLFLLLGAAISFPLYMLFESIA